MWILIAVPVLWLVVWVVAAKKDAQDKRKEDIGYWVKTPNKGLRDAE